MCVCLWVIDFLSCMAKDVHISSRVLAHASYNAPQCIKSKDDLHKSQIWLLNPIQNENNQTVFMSYSKAVCTHPTSTKVSDQLTKMTKS